VGPVEQRTGPTHRNRYTRHDAAAAAEPAGEALRTDSPRRPSSQAAPTGAHPSPTWRLSVGRPARA